MCVEKIVKNYALDKNFCYTTVIFLTMYGSQSETSSQSWYLSLSQAVVIYEHTPTYKTCPHVSHIHMYKRYEIET